MTHEQRCGKDTLVKIFSANEDHLTDSVVMWCPKCGAIVVDLEYDTQILPGEVVPMKFPEMSTKTWALMDQYPPAKFGQA